MNEEYDKYEEIKQLKGYIKECGMPINNIISLCNKFENEEIKISGIYEDLHKQEFEIDIPKDFEFKTKPFAHQIDGVRFGLNKKKFLLCDDQGLGKALALDTKIYTPDGYKCMRDIQVGDYVFNKSGLPTKVTATYNHKNVEMYRITFSDGCHIDCCKDHLWEINSQHGRKKLPLQKAEQYLATTPPERRLGETFRRLTTTDMVKESMPPALYSKAF